MVEPLSPFGAAWRTGVYGNLSNGVGVTLSDPRPGSIVEVAAWPGEEAATICAIRAVTGLSLPEAPGGGVAEGAKAGFGDGPGRFLLIDDEEGLAERLERRVSIEAGTVTDLSHGRTAIRVEGRRAEWVLAKFFALDFSPAAFPLHAGRATAHHDILAAIQRSGKERFDLYVFRSFARSFWKALCDGAEEVGYEVS